LPADYFLLRENVNYSFWKTKFMLPSLIAVLRPGNPWPSCQRSPAVQKRLPPPSNPRLAPRGKTADQRLRILERLTTGLSVAHIARVEKLTVPREQQIIAAMLESREIDPPAGFVQLQVARLSEAMIVTRTMMMEDDLQAVDRMITLTRELDRYHGFGQAQIPAPPEPPTPRRLVGPAGRPQLTNSTLGTRPMRNFPPRKALKSLETAKESRKSRRRRNSPRQTPEKQPVPSWPGSSRPSTRRRFRPIGSVPTAYRRG
jgi:hypothetical protein